MVTTSSTPTTLDRGASNGTSGTNTTATSGTSANTGTTTVRTENSNDSCNGSNNEVFIDQSAAAQYDSMLAEHIIRIRQLHRDESSRASLTMSQNSAELLNSNEFDSSTISSNMISRPTHVHFATSDTISCDVASSQDTEAETRMKQKERALRLSGSPQPPNEGAVTIPNELNSSMNIMNKKRTIQEVPVASDARSNGQENIALGGAPSPTTLRRNPHVDGVVGTGSHTNSTNFTNERHPHDMVYDSQQHSLEMSHVNHVPIEAFSVQDIPAPVHAVQVSMGDPDDDDDDHDHDDSHTGNRNISFSNNINKNSTHHSAKKAPKKKANRKKRIVAIALLCIVAAIIISVVLVGSICGSGAVTCRRNSSTSSGSSNSNNNGTVMIVSKTDDDDRAIMIYSYINNISFAQDVDASAKLVPASFNYSALREKAVDWIIHDDPLQLNITESQHSYFRLRQRYALAALWFHTSIDNAWGNTSGWLSDEDECNWYGITCTIIDHGDDIGIQSTVIGLNMSSNSMNGILPADLAFLSNLRLLRFDFNAIAGSIPDSIGQCTDLERVELEFNYLLTGTLPDSLMNWRNLTHFDISNNEFSGLLPTWLGSWLYMTFFSASSNQFNSTLPSSLGLWNNIQSFDVNLNHLHGSLPESIGNWTEIGNFGVTGNSLTGSIPTTLGNWDSLYQLALEENNFTGTIPNVIGSLGNLIYIFFEHNAFTGSVPQGLCDNNVKELIANCSVTCACCTDCI
jgi:hypothetical protein